LTAAAKELHIASLHLQRVSVLAVAVLPFFDAEPAFDINRASFCEVFRGVFGLLTPKRDAEPSCDVLLFACFITLFLVCCHRKITDRNALRRVSEFRVAAEISYKNYFIERHFLEICLRVVNFCVNFERY
jgi:hypothetical protein